MRPDASSRLTVRAGELAQVEAVLARGEPSIVAISGPPAIGKSTLLAAIAERASALGCRVVGRPGEPHAALLTVTPETTIQEFCAGILADLGPRPGSRGVPGTSMASSAADEFLEPAKRVAIALEALHQPVALLFDGYRPSLEVDHEVTSMFERLRSAAVPVVIVLADREPERTELGAKAVLALTLGAFDDDEVRAYLDEATAGVEPPLSQREREVYVDAIRTRPEYATSLTRLFTVITASDGTRGKGS